MSVADWAVLMKALSIRVQAVPFSKGTTQQEKDAIADYMIGVADLIAAYPVPQFVSAMGETIDRLNGNRIAISDRLEAALTEHERLADSHYAQCCKIEALQDKVIKNNRQISEMRTALEIAFPSMAHTYSGHEDPSIWVDGCGKCRVARLLTQSSERNPVEPHPPRAEGDLAPPGNAAGDAASVSAPAGPVSHCKSPYCINGDKCRCQCYSCLAIVNF